MSVPPPLPPLSAPPSPPSASSPPCLSLFRPPTFIEGLHNVFDVAGHLPSVLYRVVGAYLVEHVALPQHEQDAKLPGLCASIALTQIPNGGTYSSDYKTGLRYIESEVAVYLARSQFPRTVAELVYAHIPIENAFTIDGSNSAAHLRVLVRLSNGVYVFFDEWSYGGHVGCDGDFFFLADFRLRDLVYKAVQRTHDVTLSRALLTVTL